MSYPNQGAIPAQDTGRIASPAPQYTSGTGLASPPLEASHNPGYTQHNSDGIYNANTSPQTQTNPNLIHQEKPHHSTGPEPVHNTYNNPSNNNVHVPEQVYQQNNSARQDNYQEDKSAQAGFQSNPQHGGPRQGGGGGQYANATPIGSLQQGPAPVDCPICGVRELTRTEFVSGGTTHLSAILCCCCLCLGCIPYMASWFKDCEHNCGNCGALLAVWHRSGSTEVIAHART